MDHTDFVEHGYCLLWEPGLVRLHVISDIITGLSYYSIALALFYFVYKRRNLPFMKIFVLFGIFIFACGTTHLFSAYTIYVPVYWEEGIVKAVTAALSILAAIVLIPLMPRAIALPSLTQALEESKKAEQKFRTLFDGNTDGLVMVEMETRKLEMVNRKMCEMLGYEEEEVTNLSLHDIHPEEDLAYVLEQFDRDARGEITSAEVPVKRKNGTVFYAEVNSSHLISSGKEYIMGAFRDITQRRLSEKALAKSEEKYRTLHQSMMDGFVLVDMNGHIREFNGAYRSMLGYTQEELLNMTYLDITPSKWHAFEKNIITEQIVTRGFSDVYVKEYLTKDGRTLPVELRIFLIKDDKGNNTGMWAIVRDMSERMRADEAVWESEKRYHSLFQHMLSGFAYCRMICDDNNDPVDFIYIDVNSAFEHLTGLKDVIGKRVTEVIPGIRESSSDLFEVYNRVALTGNPERLETYVPSIGIWFSLSVYSTERGYFVAIFDNITARRQAEEERKRLELQLRQAQKMEAVGQLAGGVAHDFNNIINAIMGYCSLIQMKISPDSPAREYANEIFAASERAAALTGSLLAFGRKQVINIKPISLNSTVGAMGQLLRNFLREDLRLVLDLTENDMVVMADAGQVDQILMNLTTNARDAMPDGGTLTVSTQGIMIDEEFKTVHGYGHSGKYALITVEDTGHGIAAETQEKIFEPFFTTKEVGKGSGLGLAIVYGIVKQHKGYIDVYSEEGKGTSFKIYLPSIDFVHEESAMKERPPMVGGTETILLTEDESLLRAATKAMLEKMGYCVLEAADGEQAVRVFMENKDVIDIMVMDVIMPAKGGLDAYKEIAVIKPYVKVIFMSGYAGDTIAKNIIEEGLELMQKPVLPMELLYKIRTILDMGKRKP